MRIEHFEAADVDHFQQFVEQHQQLPLKLLATTLVGEDAFDLMQHLDQDFLGVAHNQTAERGAENDDYLGRLPEHAHVAVRHGVAAQHAADDDEGA